LPPVSLIPVVKPELRIFEKIQNDPNGLLRAWGKLIREKNQKQKIAAGINDTGGKFHRYQRHRRQICHHCQRHRWQTMGLISGCRYLKVNLKAKIYIYVNSTIQMFLNKIFKIFHLPFGHLVNLELRISPRIFKKIRNGPNGILWGWGETDS
jgi:hypothetical protein